jgi:hypothetical protein
MRDMTLVFRALFAIGLPCGSRWAKIIHHSD